MPLELIFTSVPKGVKPGSTGYCTVAKHKGIDRLLDQAIEKICYYELMNHPAKPVVCSYRIMRLNTGIFHVLTRTVYSGSDHTGRTNYLSHNLIFDQRRQYRNPLARQIYFWQDQAGSIIGPLVRLRCIFRMVFAKFLFHLAQHLRSHWLFGLR